MSKFIADDGRTHIQSTLMRESLQDRSVIGATDSERDFQILPDVTFVSIGGQSIFDRGKDAIVPLVAEIAELHAAKARMVLAVGGGTRVRHTMAVALDLGLPIGGVAQLVGGMEELNAVLLNALLAKHGSLVMPRDHFWELPLYLNSGMIPIVISVPPYHLWEPPAASGHIPIHGSDFGIFQQADVLGMERVIYVKDEDGLYESDPKVTPGARRYERVTLAEILADPPQTTIVDRELFETWRHARNIKQIQIINGLKPGALGRAYRGEPEGTIVVKEPS